MPQQAEITARYRGVQHALAARTGHDVVKLWPALDWLNLAKTYPVAETAYTLLVNRDRQAATAAARAYLAASSAAADVADLEMIDADPLPVGKLQTSLRVTIINGFTRAREAGMLIPEAADTALVMATGAMTRHVLDAGRETVMATTVAAPEARGWQRVNSGGGCDFCQMLVGRGAVYTEETAAFESHDHCRCSAEPVWR